MGRADRHLVRCAGCGRNFETELFGELACPYCRSKVWIEPPEGYVPPPDISEKISDETDNQQTASAAGELLSADEDHAASGSADSANEDTHSPEPEPTEPQRLEDLRRLLESTLKARKENSARGPAWEQKQGGLLTRFTSTIKSVLSSPSAFFASLPDAGYARAFLFGWIVCTVGVAFFCLYGLWQIDANYQANLDMLKANGELSKLGISPEHVLDAIKELLGISLVAAPVLGAINLLFSALLNHLGILLVAGRRMGLKVTLRATAYGFAPLLILGVPVIGNLLGGIWAIVLQVIAMSKVHKLSTSRASLAVFLPLLSAMILFMAILP